MEIKVVIEIEQECTHFTKL